ncbi:MAG: hypothetical protein L3K06_00325 [Thermoplasmata archaeon]|nr:hypothetical protein [Thermoplasmata archaeon]
MATGRIFSHPGTLFLCGNSRPLLNWTAYALAASTDPSFFWTDIRLRGEVLDATDPLARSLVPSDRLSILHPFVLTRNVAGADIANAASGAVIRSDEPPDAVRRLVEFLRLPSHTQEVLSSRDPEDPPMVIVLSNAHRVVALYPTATVAPILRPIVEAGALLVATWADAPPEGRLSFDTILHLRGDEHGQWRRASLTVEKSAVPGILRLGENYPLESLAPIAAILESKLH